MSDKLHAEVMAACGSTILEISRQLERPPITIRYWLIASVAERMREKAKQSRAADPERHRRIRQRYRAANLDAARRYYREWSDRNKDYCRERNAAYYRENIEERKKSARLYRENNKEAVKAALRSWRSKNKIAISASNKAKREINIEQARARVREWRRLNPEASKESCRISRSRRRSARTRALVAATVSQVRQRKECFKGKCAYCGSAENITIDHVLPIKLGGLDEASNLAPACFSCNTSKGAKPVEEWYKSKPFFSKTRWSVICKHCPHAKSSQLSIRVDC